MRENQSSNIMNQPNENSPVDRSNTSLFEPDSEANRILRQAVAPDDWANPVPAGRYNLVVIGAGGGGLITAAGAAGLGAKVALIEKEALGGDCLNVGCVPSKALISAARVIAKVRASEDYGVNLNGAVEVDFPKVMERMRKLRAGISANDSVTRFSELGVDVFLGRAEFKDADTVIVDGQELKFSKAVIATGARAAILPIPGLKEAGVLTNETVFSLEQLPQRLAIIGAGPIGCEMAQAFVRFGSEVTMFEAMPQILGREDADAAAIIRDQLKAEGVRIICGAKIEAVSRDGVVRRIHGAFEGTTEVLEFDEVLLGVGRSPNVENMGLEAAGVTFDKRIGVDVDERLQTSNPRIYAVGDVCLKYKFTHMADASARMVIQNALFHGRKKQSDLLVPWCTYTEPEIAHVGLYEQEAKEAHGAEVETFRQNFDDVDRSILEGETEGFVKVHAMKGRIVGATIVGTHAGDMISEVSVAMRGGMSLGQLASVIHPYPTAAEAIRKVGDAYNRKKFTPFVAKLFKKWLAWTR